MTVYDEKCKRCISIMHNTSAERIMLIAESGRVHLHGVVTRDVVHVNSGVREGSPPRRSYEGCGSC